MQAPILPAARVPRASVPRAHSAGRRAPQTHGRTQSTECLLGKEPLGRSKEVFRFCACFCQRLFSNE